MAVCHIFLQSEGSSTTVARTGFILFVFLCDLTAIRTSKESITGKKTLAQYGKGQESNPCPNNNPYP